MRMGWTGRGRARDQGDALAVHARHAQHTASPLKPLPFPPTSSRSGLATSRKRSNTATMPRTEMSSRPSGPPPPGFAAASPLVGIPKNKRKRSRKKSARTGGKTDPLHEDRFRIGASGVPGEQVQRLPRTLWWLECRKCAQRRSVVSCHAEGQGQSRRSPSEHVRGRL
jgi:hypothetical protein